LPGVIFQEETDEHTPQAVRILLSAV